MLQHARLDNDRRATSEATLAHMLAKIPDWYAAMASQDVREYRRLLGVARRLKGAKRGIRWSIDVAAMARDFEKLRADIFKRTGN